MATQHQHTTYILGYVIAIILILSNVQIVSANKNNQYATTSATTTTTASATTAFANALEGTDDSVAVLSTQQFHTSPTNAYRVSELATPTTTATTVRSVETKSISASHDGAEFMQPTLHNASLMIDEELNQQRKNQKEVQHKQVERASNSSRSSSSSSSNDQQPSVHTEYLVQQDDENPKQLLSSMQSLSTAQQRDRQLNPNPKEKHQHHQLHAQVIQQSNEQHSALPLSYHDKFMNENKKTPNAIESNTGIMATAATGAKMKNAQLDKHNQPMERITASNGTGSSSGSGSSHGNRRSDDDNDDSRKTDEITAMPMKMVRDNVNATSDSVFRVNESDGIANVNKTLAFDNGNLSANDMANARGERTNNNDDGDRDGDGDDDKDDDSVGPFSLEQDLPNQKFNERSRYLETDLPESTGFQHDDDVNVNDQLDWHLDGAHQFEELTLNDEDDDDDEDQDGKQIKKDGDNNKSLANMQARSWNQNSRSIESKRESITAAPSSTLGGGTQNILKLTKSNKSKAIKRVAGASPPQIPQALLEIRLNKSPPMSTTNENQFINSHSFRYITNLYDQYEWDADELRTMLSHKCASDMDVYLNALLNGKTWAAKANDASGRYRGQFLFDNNHWLGSFVVCDELSRINEMDLSFFLATVLIRSPEPMIKRHILRVGQCLPRICSLEDIRVIMNMDISARKFADNFQNATSEMDKAEIGVVSVRRVPDDYNVWQDRLYYLVVFICITFMGITIWATIYENSLASTQETSDENVSPSRQAIHPLHMSKTAKTNGQRIYPYENATIDVESTEPALKMDKMHANNIINGCTFELHPISIEHNNGNHLANNNRAAFYRLNNNNANNINNNHHAGNNDDANDNNHLKRMPHTQNGTTYATKTIPPHDAKHLSIRQRLLLCFGLSTNMKTILSMKKLPQESIACIHGLRVFSMFWTILVHTYLQLFAISENRYSKRVSERTFWFQILGNASYTVDTFFFISGLLVTLLFLRSKTSTKGSTDGGFIVGAKQSLLLVIYRYLRLTPVYFMVIIINAVTLKYVYNAAVFTPGLPDHITCPNYWWRNILYIQTWFPFPQLCMLWSWYLADDMQFYVWAIVILILSKRHGRTAVALIVTFLLTSWAVSALISLKFNYTHKIAEPLESFGYLYEKPWTRLGPYVMGMLAGYVLNRYQTAPSAITPFINVVLWMMSMGAMLLLVFGVWNGTLNLIWTALYVSLGHSAWGLALVWIVLSCKWGLAKPINRLLSLRAMLPLSRLTYCAYLIHPVSQIAMSLDIKGTIHIQHGFVFTIFLGNVVISYALAFILSLLFEAPIIRLLKIIFSKQ